MIIPSLIGVTPVYKSRLLWLFTCLMIPLPNGQDWTDGGDHYANMTPSHFSSPACLSNQFSIPAKTLHSKPPLGAVRHFVQFKHPTGTQPPGPIIPEIQADSTSTRIFHISFLCRHQDSWNPSSGPLTCGSRPFFFTDIKLRCLLWTTASSWATLSSILSQSLFMDVHSKSMFHHEQFKHNMHSYSLHILH